MLFVTLLLMFNTIRMKAVSQVRTIAINVLRRNTNVRNVKPLLINSLHEKCQDVWTKKCRAVDSCLVLFQDYENIFFFFVNLFHWFTKCSLWCDLKDLLKDVIWISLFAHYWCVQSEIPALLMVAVFGPWKALDDVFMLLVCLVTAPFSHIAKSGHKSAHILWISAWGYGHYALSHLSWEKK